MLAGGQVLSALRKQDGTHIEVLQIPLSENLIPDGHESASKGRFVVIDYGSGQVTDPAIFDKGNTRITVVGKVLGSATVTIDDVQLKVPQLALKHVTVWDWDRVQSGYQPSPAMPTRMAGAMAASMGPAIIGNMGCLDRHFRREKLS